MQVILLERIGRLGQIGDVVSVKPGFARNFLLPQKKALRATKANKEYFESQRIQLEAQNLEQKKDAEAIGDKLAGKVFIAIRQSSDSGQLYGSVTTRDIAMAITEAGFTIARQQVELVRPIKTLGLHPINIILHPEVIITIEMNVARSEEEAERQAKGEDVTAKTEDPDAYKLENTHTGDDIDDDPDDDGSDEPEADDSENGEEK
jgi:large subunit ribosomal protein L9